VGHEAVRLADELAALISGVEIGQRRPLMAAFITRLIEATRLSANAAVSDPPG
jgi:hypothetical protein